MQRRTYLAALLVAAAATGCDDDTVAPRLEVATVEVAPAGRVIGVGDTLRLTAFPRTAAGDVLGGVAVTWSLEGDDAGRLTTDGARATLLAEAAGVVRVIASSGGRQGLAEVTVMPAPPVAVGLEVSPQSARLQQDRTLRLEAAVRADDGTILGGKTVTWRTSNGAIATVDVDANSAIAVVSARSPGRAVITAAAEGFEVPVEIVVDPAPPEVSTVLVEPASRAIWQGLSHAFTAEARDVRGEPVMGRTVQWETEDTTVATVTPDGMVHGHRIGTTRVIARIDDVTGWATVKVVAQPGATMTYDLLPNRDPSGGPRLTVIVGTGTWTDPDGNERLAYHWLMGGRLDLDLRPGAYTWTQELEVHVVTWDPVSEQTMVVEVRRLTDHGAVYFDLMTGSFMLASDDHPGTVHATAFLDAELLEVRQAVGSVGTLSYVYRLR